MNMQMARPFEATDNNLSRLLALAIWVLILIGFVWSNSIEQLLAYLLIVFSATLPSILWVRVGAVGIPALPVMGAAYIPYFGWPILSSGQVRADYTDWEIFRAALTVTLFLMTACFAWFAVLSSSKAKSGMVLDQFENERVVRLVMVGLWVGVLFAVAGYTGYVDWMGYFYGMARAVTGTLATVACFLTGVTRAQGILRGNAWIGAVAGVAVLVLINWTSLFLVMGVVYLLAVLFGYSIFAKRIPWAAILSMFAVVTILHAGKPELRAKYWDSDALVTSVWSLPGLMIEWVGEGIYAITSGAEYQSPLERTGLMHMLLFAQIRTPDSIDYLNGATYQLLPSILVPRFLDENKPISGAGMEMINVHYGIFGENIDSFTSIGWGLVAEAYANYGYICVAAVAAFLGLLTGALHRWSIGAAVISMPTLLSIAVMMALINVEADFIQVCSTILQSFAAVLIFHTGFKTFALTRNPSSRSGAGVA